MLGTVASQKGDSGFKPADQLGPFCAEFARSPTALVGFLQKLWLPPIIQKHADYVKQLV